MIGERNYKSLSIYNKNHKAIIHYKMERVLQRIRRNDKNVSYSISDGIAVSSLKWVPPGIVA